MNINLLSVPCMYLQISMVTNKYYQIHINILYSICAMCKHKNLKMDLMNFMFRSPAILYFNHFSGRQSYLYKINRGYLMIQIIF